MQGRLGEDSAQVIYSVSKVQMIPGVSYFLIIFNKDHPTITITKVEQTVSSWGNTRISM